MLKDNLKAARLAARMTLDEVAQKVGVSRQTIQRYESGVIQNIPSDNIEKIACALGVSPGQLMGWEKPTHTKREALVPFHLVLRSLRQNRGLTQEELAKRMGYKSRSSINKIEKGENDIPQSKIIAFAQALGTTPEALMGWDTPPNTANILTEDPSPPSILLRAEKELPPEDLKTLADMAEFFLRKNTPKG